MKMGQICKSLNLVNLIRPGWKWCVITLTHFRTCHIKNTDVVCHTLKTLYVAFSQLLPIHSVYSLLITVFTISLVKSSVPVYSTFYLLFFFHTVTVGFSCNKYSRRFDFVYQFFHLNFC